MKRYALLVSMLLPSTASSQAVDVLKNIQRAETMMGVYLVHSPRRHESERVQFKRGTLKVDIWHPVHRMSDVELKTRAVQWLVFGRTQYATGARGIFSEIPSVDRVILRFHEVTRAGKNTRRRGAREKVMRFLALSLKRRDFERLKIPQLERCVDQVNCASQFKTLFTKSFFDRRYTKKRRSQN